MKVSLIVLCLFLAGNSYGQINNFKTYQQAINKAELKLIAGDKAGALDSYFLTLRQPGGNFSKDIYNALLLAKELSRTDSFFVLLDLLTKKGLSNEYLNELEQFDSLHGNRKWMAFLQKNTRYSSINKTLRSQMDSLSIQDQLFRTKEGSYKVYGDTIRKIDSTNMAFLYALIAKDKFPGEDGIGVSSVFGNQGYDILFHHYTQTSSNDKKLNKITPLLINLVQQGKILPNKCAHWLEMQNSEFKAGVFDITGFKVDGKERGYFRPVYSSVQRLVIDEYRKMLCLEPLDDYYKKFLFVISHPDSKYNFDVRVNNFNVDEKSFLVWSGTMVEIK